VISLVPKEEGSKSQHVVIQLQSTFLSQSLEPSHQIIFPYSDTSTANSEFLHQVLVFVSPTWFFSRIKSQVLFHSIRKNQLLLQSAAYKSFSLQSTTTKYLVKFSLSTRIQCFPLCSSDTRKICVHTVLWEEVCVHYVFIRYLWSPVGLCSSGTKGEGMCYSGTEHNSAFIRY
jgi:hypothetical protein